MAGGFFDYWRRVNRPGQSATPGTTTVRVAMGRQRLTESMTRQRLTQAMDRDRMTTAQDR